MPQRDASFDDILRSGLAGGIAGCVAKTVVAPLDRVKILFQTSNPDFKSYSTHWAGVFRAGRDIYADAGVRGLLQGHSATLARVFPYAAIKFMTYDVAHQALMPTREAETNSRRFAAGAISGFVSVAFTYPLELVRVRMAFETRHARLPTQPSSSSSAPMSSSLTSPSPTAKPPPAPRPSITHVMSLIYKEGAHAGDTPATPSLFSRFPLLNFYRGFTVTIVGILPYAGMSFLVWGYLRARFLPPSPTSKSGGSGKRKSTSVADLAVGAVSGAIAQTASYPFEVVRRRMQVGGLTNPGRWMRWDETARSVWRDAVARVPPGTTGLRRSLAGAQGFYVGLTIGYLKVVPMSAVSYMVWEAGKRALGV